MLEGLRTAIYSANDMDAARDWYTRMLGYGPYFDEPFYMGFDVGGYELGIQPADDARLSPEGVTVHWGVGEIEGAYRALLSIGATENEPPSDVGDGIKVATVLDPFSNVLGIIENPSFGPSKAP